MKPKFRFHRHRPVLALGITLVLSHLPQANAADGTWTTDGDGAWSGTTNWSGGIVADGVDSTANFSNPGNDDFATYINVHLDSARTVGNLTFDTPNFLQGVNWNLSNYGNAANILTLATGSGSPTITVNGGASASISATIAGTAGLTKTGNGGLSLTEANTYTGATKITQGTLYVYGSGTLGNNANLTIDADTPVYGGGSLWLGGTTQTVGAVSINGEGQKISYGNLIGTSFAIDNSGDYSSSISAGLGGVGAGLSKTGTEATVLSGLNTYTGVTSIEEGTLQFAKTASLYNSDELQWTQSNISVASGATLAINVGGVNGFTAAQAGTLLGNLSSGLTNNGLQAGSTFAIDTSYGPASTTFDQAITDSTGTGGGALGFTKLGSKTLVLTQANTYTGPTTITGGTLAISGAGTLGTNSAIIVGDYGALDLGGTAQTVGDVTINGGSISNGSVVGSSYTVNGGFGSYGSSVSASMGGDGVALTVNGGVTLSGANTYSGDTTINGGSITISGAGTLGSNSNVVINNGSLDLGGTSQSVGSVSVNHTSGSTSISSGNLIGTSFELNSSAPLNIFPDATVYAGLGGTGAGLVKTGSGQVLLGGVNTYTGTTTISEGILSFSTASALYNSNESEWTKTNISAESGGTFAITMGGLNGFTTTQAKSLLTELTVGIDNNGLQAGSAFGIHVGITGDMTFDQVIADSTGAGGGSLGLTKLGFFGKLTLNQANTYTGATTILGGTLAISGAGTLGDHADLRITGFGAGLDLGGTTQTVGDVVVSTDSTYGQVSNGNLIGTSYAVESGSISAGLGGVGAALTKSGEGEVTLSGTNTYTGTTTVDGGTLQFEKTNSLYNGDAASWSKSNISVASGATLGVNVGGTGEFSISQAKSLLTNLTTSINNNGLQAGSTFAIDTNNATGDTTFDQVIANSTGTGGGALGLTKEGAGKLILNQANTYTGPTTVNGGSLAISGLGKLGNSALAVGAAGELDLGGTTQSVGAVSIMGAVSNGNLIATGYDIGYDGTIAVGLGGTGANLVIADYSSLKLSGVNTYTGTTSVGYAASLQLAKVSSLYNGDTSKWTAANITVDYYGTLAVNVGGAGEFSVAQAKTLLGNLTTSQNDNGLRYGATFGIDTSNAAGNTTFNQVIADSTGISGGRLNFAKMGANSLILNQANTYSGDTSIQGGTLKMGLTNALSYGNFKGNVLVGSGGTFDINGFDTSINGLELSGSVVNGAIGTTKKLTLGNGHTDATFDGTIADNSGIGGTLALEKTGNGTQTLNGTNSYTGETTVSGGTLIVNGSISTSILTTVGEYAVLAGSGSVGELLVEVGGTVSPGNSPGILSTGDLTMAGTLAAEINGTEVGTDYDQLDVTGIVTLSGMLTLTMTGFTPTDGNLFFLINNDGIDEINGTFSGLAQGSNFTMAGQLWSISYDANSGSNAFDGGNDVALMAMTAIPEPSVALLGGLGLLALLRRRRG